MYYLDFNLYKDLCEPSVLTKIVDVDSLLSDDNLKWFDVPLVTPPYFVRGDKSRYYPVDVMTTIRTMYSNEVLCKENKCYEVKQCNQKYPHRGADLIMYETSRLVFTHIDFEKAGIGDINDIMYHSVFQFMGFTTFSDCPTLYTTVVLQDEYAEKLKPFLLPNHRFERIDDIKALDDNSNPKCILDALVLVKGENNE